MLSRSSKCGRVMRYRQPVHHSPMFSLNPVRWGHDDAQTRDKCDNCYFLSQQQPRCNKYMCLLEGPLKSSRAGNGKCAATTSDEAVSATEVMRNLALRLSDIESERSSEAMKLKEDKKLQAKKFLVELNLWFRDTVLTHAMYDAPMLGVMGLADPGAETELGLYLPEAEDYFIVGRHAFGHKYNDWLEHNMIAMESHIENTMDISLEMLFTALHEYESNGHPLTHPHCLTTAEVAQKLTEFLLKAKCSDELLYSYTPSLESAEARRKLSALTSYCKALKSKSPEVLRRPYRAGDARSG